MIGSLAFSVLKRDRHSEPKTHAVLLQLHSIDQSGEHSSGVDL
jgi:hypothetical protein